MKLNKTVWFAAAFLTSAAAATADLRAAQQPPYDDKPIIAHMLSQPQLYDRKTVTIYGLVIEASEGGTAFLLQDVSQMPLAVRVATPDRVKKGDQIMAQGVFHARGAEPLFKASVIKHTKVLGGGGCC